MPKKKLAKRMDKGKRLNLYGELSRYKSGAPIAHLARKYGVSTGTVNHWWKKVKADRKQKPLLATAPALPIALVVGQTLSRKGNGAGLAKPFAPRIDIEALIRDEARKYLDEAFRKA